MKKRKWKREKLWVQRNEQGVIVGVREDEPPKPNQLKGEKVLG
ncbi:hypothetical protein [Paenibacillus methanolicus]|uniref:Uncharacterized protein n=1 Tax=Paenibacillus methanolicus TaxID=582686 RepID=A0A5S5BRH9_9BACL|nr:hypothetical protein [Paenibacillus methanolicus]TYP68896.1 hypothetical protein BCM02_11714 [Paenibacillus methanolicus]